MASTLAKTSLAMPMTTSTRTRSLTSMRARALRMCKVTGCAAHRGFMINRLMTCPKCCMHHGKYHRDMNCCAPSAGSDCSNVQTVDTTSPVALAVVHATIIARCTISVANTCKAAMCFIIPSLTSKMPLWASVLPSGAAAYVQVKIMAVAEIQAFHRLLLF